MAAYGATITADVTRERISRELCLMSGICVIDNYNTTGAEITDITSYFGTIIRVVCEGLSTGGYVVRWNTTDKCFHAFYPTNAASTHTHAYGTLSDAASAAGSAHQHAAITAGTPAGTNANESTHTHAFGTLSDAASAAGSAHQHAAITAGTPAGTNAADTSHTHAVALDGGATGVGAAHTHTFTGSALATHQHDAITAGTPAGTNAAETAHTHAVALDGGATGVGAAHTHTFTGSALATHQHDAITAGTPAGTNAVSDLTHDLELVDINAISKPTITLTHNLDPVGNLAAAALYAYEAQGASDCGNVIYLQSTTAANADVNGETANGSVHGVAESCRFWVKDNDTPSGVQIYINEASSDQLEFVSPTNADGYILMPFEMAAGAPPAYCVVKVHDNDAAASGKALYFDDNGAADAQLAFNDAGTAGGTIPAADVIPLRGVGFLNTSAGLGTAKAQTFTGSALGTHQHAAVTAGTPAGTNANESTHTHGFGTLTDAASAAGSSHTHTFTGTALATHQHAAVTAGTPAGTNANEGAHTHAFGTLADAASGVGSSHTHVFTGSALATHQHATENAHTHAVALDGGATAVGAAHTHVFTGSALATHQHATENAHTHAVALDGGATATGGSITAGAATEVADNVTDIGTFNFLAVGTWR